MGLLLPEAAVDAIGLEGTVEVRSGRVTRLETPHGLVWVKSVEPPSKTWRRNVLYWFSRILPIPILRPSLAGKGGDTLLRQAEQAEAFRAAGLNPAIVYYVDREFLILNDGGENVERAVRGLKRTDVTRAVMDRTLAHAVLLQITSVLAEIHQKGFAHGRPKMRDFAWRGNGAIGDVTILDLEERPSEVMPMPTAQARDIYLWLVDLCCYPASRVSAEKAMRLLSETMSDATRAELIKLRRLLSVAAIPIRLLSKTPFRNREMVGAIGAYDTLKTL